jgi:predicted ATP-grasp superfamily ATP-dependent carboligase/protein-tyrosine-phosphatase
MSNKTKILLLGLTNKSGLGVARSLRKSGCVVDAILFKDVAAKYSRFIKKTYHFGDPAVNADQCINRMIEHLEKENYDALIPIHDGALELCRYRKEEISSKVKIVGLNVDDAYKYSIDKSELLKAGKEFGLLIPEGILITSLAEYQEADLSGYTFPIVAKPVSSAKIVNNKWVGFSVKICNTEAELRDFVRENINIVPMLIQEFVEGYGIGYNFIAKDGEILNAYIHRRINEYKGVSTYRESLLAEEYGVEDKIKQLIKYTKWNGVGMVEFKVDSDGTPKLMEFNGRFFGSIEVSARAGVNLPKLFLELFILNNEIPRELPVKKVAVRFLHDEVLLMTEAALKLKLKTYFKWLGQVIASTFKRNSFVEDSIFTDPGFSMGMYLFDVKRIFRKRYTAIKIKTTRVKPLKKENLQGVKTIAFFCHGNICRSPFAKLVADNLSKDYVFDSGGIVVKEDRISPVNAVLASKKFNVDLSTHLSKSLYSFEKDNVDLFIVMDKKNYHTLLKEGIQSSKVYFLSNKEVNDPYSKGVEYFEEIYESINKELVRIFR